MASLLAQTVRNNSQCRRLKTIPNLGKTAQQWESLGFPGGPGVKNLPCNARGSLVQEDATEQLNLCSTTTEPEP